MTVKGQTVAVAVAAAIGTALVAGCAGQSAPSSSTSEPPRNPAPYVEGTPFQPAFEPDNFVQGIDNPFLPFRPGTTLVYRGVSNGERERVEVTTTNETKEILGITATVVRDQVFVRGELAEDTFDWYAQDRAGNVWYLGEDTEEYEKGKVVSTAGSWEAGVDGAQPGIVMLGDPRPGDTYRQEYYRGEAEDVGRVVALEESVTVPQGAFDEVLVTEDWTPLDPSSWRTSSTPEASGWYSSAWSREAKRSFAWSRSGRPSGRRQRAHPSPLATRDVRHPRLLSCPANGPEG